MTLSSVLRTKDKIGYGLGDMASALVWQTATLFLAYFYTDVFGLPAAIMGTMFLVVRVVDAFVDPCIGALVDRTQTRHGRFRPWLLWFAIPFGVSCLITFYVPDVGPTAKIVYACLTYAILSLIYSAINVPYCAMPGALTLDPRERHSLQSWRFGLSFIGGLIVTVIALPLVSLLGQGNVQKGYFYAMSLMGLLGIVLFFCCFLMTRERYSPRNDTSGSMLTDLKLLGRNSQWRIVFLFNILLLTAVVTRGSATMYYVNYVLLRPDLVFAFIVSGMVASLSGALLSERLLGKFDRVRAYQWTIISFVIFGALIFFLPPSQVWLIFGLNIVFSFIQTSPRRSSGPCSPMWSTTKSIAAAVAWTGWSSPPRCLPSNLAWRSAGRWWAGYWAWWIMRRARQPRRRTCCRPLTRFSPLSHARCSSAWWRYFPSTSLTAGWWIPSPVSWPASVRSDPKRGSSARQPLPHYRSKT